jgi:hypothetical protein
MESSWESAVLYLAVEHVQQENVSELRVGVVVVLEEAIEIHDEI